MLKDKPTRREFLTRGATALAGLTMLGGLPGVASCAKDPQKKPNVVFIFADQFRNCSLGCMGAAEVKTPHFDELASQGMLFTDAVSGYPLCTPYRAMLLTGRYGTSTGMVSNEIELPSGEVTIAETFKQQGYKTGFIGKWHLEKNHDPFVPKEHRHGFDFWASRNLGGEYFDSFYCADTPDQIPIPGYEMDGQTDIAIDFMKKNTQSPFFLMLAWRAPHPPIGAPSKYEKMYDAARLTQRPNVPRDMDLRADLVKYYGMITNLDDNMGRIMKALDDMGIADDTIICFSSDHGDMFGSQGLRGKNVPYEESVNVPFIMRYPRAIKPGQKTDCMINSVDVMPTLLSMCGVPIPRGVQGHDLSPVILGKDDTKPEAVLLQRIIDVGNKANAEWRGVRTAQYTYTRTREKAWLLFDNEKDPYQKNNLVNKPEYKAVQDKLEAQLQAMMKKIGDKFEPSEVYIERFRPQMGKRWFRNKRAPLEE